MKSSLFTNNRQVKPWLACLVVGLSYLFVPAAWAQTTPSIKTGCAGAISARMAQTAVPYQRALTALNGSEVGWCAIAAELSTNAAKNAFLWEFSSAAFVFHALRGKKELTPAQQNAMRELLARIPGIGNPPTRLKQIDNALYVHMRTMAAEDSTDTMMVLDIIKQYSPATYRTLMRRSVRWGDADDN